MQTSLFDYHLPRELIAQQPAEPRDSSRLLVLERATGTITHRHFHEIGDYLRAGDLLVANDSRVIPARLPARKQSGGALELLLLRQVDAEGMVWEALIRGKVRVGNVVVVQGGDNEGDVVGEVVTLHDDGRRTVRFSAPIRPWLDTLGEVPLPPYITSYHGDRERYQTVYSRPEGSAAAPTAGLHFSADRLLALRAQGIDFATTTLHVGLDTFKPVDAARVEDHQIHSEWAQLNADSARQINETTLRGGRVVAVGTTAVRTLEWAATGAQGIAPWPNPGEDAVVCGWQRVAAFSADVRLFIYPGYQFRAVDALITNFHLPRSSLLMLVSAFISNGIAGNSTESGTENGTENGTDVDAGRRMLLAAYEEAIREQYRFFSFGDAMLIV